jgi:hypothetical protein
LRGAVGAALGPGEQGVGGGVVDEAFGGDIPAQRAGEFHGDPTDDAGGVRAVGDRGGHERGPAGLHGFEPVEVMFGAAREFDRHAGLGEEFGAAGIEGAEAAAGNGRVFGGHAAARDEDPAIVADELEAVGEFVGDGDFDVAGVGELHAVGAVDVPVFVFRKIGLAFDAAGAAVFDVERPVQNIVVVGAPAGDHAEAVGVVAEPAGAVVDVGRVDALFGVGDERRGAEPAVVVELGRDGLGGLIGRGRVDGQTDLDGADTAEAAAADEFAGAAELLAGALLRTELEDAARFGDGGTEEHALGVRHRHGFLQVDIFAGEDGGERGLGVPVVGRADDDGVDVGTFQELTVVGHDVDARSGRALFAVEFLDEAAAAGGARGIDVAHGDVVGEAGVEDVGHVVAEGDATAANLADADAVAGRRGAEETGWDDLRGGEKAGTEQRRAGELAAGEEGHGETGVGGFWA